jgi:hypothetical protein
MRLSYVFLATALATCTSVRADEPITAANRQIYLSAGGQHLQYVEVDQHTDLDTESGDQSAAAATAVWQGTLLHVPLVYAEARYAFSRGKTAYDGFLQNMQTGAVIPWMSSTDVETADWEMRVGKAFGSSADRGMITPFIGVGGHRWVRDSSQTDAPYGYLEVYTHQYGQVGLLMQGALARRLVGSLELDVGETFGARINAPALGFATSLGSDRILGASLRLDYVVVGNWHAGLEIRETNFRYKASQVINNMFEPDSSTIQGTAMLTVGYGL